MEKLLIGTVLKPQGIRGEIKVKLYTDGYESVCGLKEIFIDDVLYPVLKMRRDKDVFMLLRNVADRNAAELLRGKDIFAVKSDIHREKGKYFICDVIGCDLLLSDGTLFGKITDILSARTDIYYLQTKLGKAIFPLIKDLNAKFNIEEKQVVVDKDVFLQEVRYED